ncbi:MAG: MCE family protein [Rhizobiaceae bacterium]|nr:MCE family protein [Rhizobiaceae bacterium]
METRANYIAVGFFTFVAILAAFGFVYWTAGGIERGETVQLRVRIPGSASGLGRGSAVLFNGVKVGDVRRVYIDINNPAVAIADAEVDRLTPITRSTKADIGLAGLTGQANIELAGGKVDEPNILQEAEERGEIAQITADPSAVTNLLQSAQSILERADSVVGQLEQFVGEAREPLIETVENVRDFSDALAANSEGVEAFLANVGKLSDTIGSVSDQLSSTLSAAEELVRAVDKDRVTSIVDNVDATTRNIREATAEIDKVVDGVNQAVASINDFASDATGMIDKANKVLDGVDPATVRTALTNFEQASTTINNAVNDVAKVTDRIGERADDVDQFITDAQQLASRLNQASVRVDGVLQKIDSLLGSEETGTLVADASATLKSFREVADTLNSRIGTITDGLARFSGQGLRDVEGLIQDGRRAIQRIEAAISELSRNPQRIITGGDGAVRQFDGRARR